jgi:hypothetical protein
VPAPVASKSSVLRYPRRARLAPANVDIIAEYTRSMHHITFRNAALKFVFIPFQTGAKTWSPLYESQSGGTREYRRCIRVILGYSWTCYTKTIYAYLYGYRVHPVGSSEKVIGTVFGILSGNVDNNVGATRPRLP